MSSFKESVESVFEFHKLPNKVFFAGTIFGFLYEYQPIDEKLFKLPQDWKSYISIIFIICLVMFLINLIIWIFTKITNYFKVIFFKKDLKKKYSNIDLFERNVIREFYLLKRNTLSFPLFDPLIQGLVDKNILIHVSDSSMGTILDGINASFRINKYITPYIDIIKDFDLPKNNTEKEIQRISSSRPHWV